MINELSSYQQGNMGLLNQVQASIDHNTRKFMVDLFQQDYQIKLTKEDLNWVSPSLRRYLVSQQGNDQQEYTLRGDKSILSFLLQSPKPDIRQKYFTAVAESSKENMPTLLKILQGRLHKANLLGYENSIQMLEGEKAFHLPDPIKAIESARDAVNNQESTSDFFKRVHMFDKGKSYVITL